MTLHVRRAAPEDAPAIATVEVQCWQNAYRGLMPDEFLDGLSSDEQTDAWRRNLLKHEDTGRKRVVVAVGDDGVLGYARVGPVEDGGREVGLLYLMYVVPTHWRRGVGTALMARALEELRDLGQREAVLWVLRENVRARRFYEVGGWHPDGRTSSEEYGGVQLEAVCYGRPLLP